MSTFDGNVAEFPDIRIDHFRKDPASKPALAYFLSHVHSDHLVGLETCRSPFIYCSPATREILLRLEKYPHRMNFSKGILERRVQTYRHLKKLLKPIPLETPTVLELAPGREIRVTLFDANHCVGAVMFLIEDDDHAILYTGDIRSEAWWVNSLLRNPVLLPYVASTDQAPLRQLDNIYLDSTFASKSDPYVQFPSKASGVMELLRQVSKYPPETLFYFDAWTFGYEEVWQALSTFLQSQIHVDHYRHSLYTSLLYSNEPRAPEAFKLIGAQCGNHFQKGCLSTEQCKIHSCEKGTGCKIWNKQFVRITPIISRYNGEDMWEAGAGGGHGDLNQQNELEIDDLTMFLELMELCADKLKFQPQLLASVKKMLTDAMENPRKKISIDGTELGVDLNGNSQQELDVDDLDDIPLAKIVPALAKVAAKSKQDTAPVKQNGISEAMANLPRQITFPYSRHSSYSELCMLIEAFKPKDIYPCTVNHRNWDPKQSMEYLFGHIYGDRPPTFRHDQIMLQHYGDKADVAPRRAPDRNRYAQETQDYEEAIAPKDDPKQSRSRSPALKSSRRASRDEDDEDEESDAKRRKVEAQGDFWPPQHIDHYSPPRRDQSDRRPSVAHSRGSESEHAERAPARDARPSISRSRASDSEHAERPRTRDRKGGGPLRTGANLAPLGKPREQRSSSADQKLSLTRQINEWQRCLSDPHRLRPLALAGQSAESIRGQQQTEKYGRLSPARSPTPELVDSPEEEPVELDEEEFRLAIQQEAYDAALGKGLDWSEIGLVSVNGHKDEVEL